MQSSPNPRSVPEIREAIALFERWEADINDPTAAKRFSEAVELLDDYLECEPESPHKQFVRNLKVSNVRSLLKHLSRVDKKDLGIWIDYAFAVVSLVGKEADSLMAANPAFKQDFDSFLAVWGDEVREALQASLARKSP
jgi:hypothetical protein